MQELYALLEMWKTRLTDSNFIAKGMDERTALGVETSRKITLEKCIKELEATIEKIK